MAVHKQRTLTVLLYYFSQNFTDLFDISIPVSEKQDLISAEGHQTIFKIVGLYSEPLRKNISINSKNITSVFASDWTGNDVQKLK